MWIFKKRPKIIKREVWVECPTEHADQFCRLLDQADSYLGRYLFWTFVYSKIKRPLILPPDGVKMRASFDGHTRPGIMYCWEETTDA